MVYFPFYPEHQLYSDNMVHLLSRIRKPVVQSADQGEYADHAFRYSNLNDNHLILRCCFPNINSLLINMVQTSCN